MTYDEDDNMTKQVDRINDVTYTYQYDSDGNVTAVSESDGFGIVYTRWEERL